MGMQHDRPTTSDAIRLPVSSSATTMALQTGLAKYWVLTNLFPGPLPQVTYWDQVFSVFADDFILKY